MLCFPVLHLYQVRLALCLFSLQTWFIAYFCCPHIEFWYTIPFSQSRWLNNDNLNFECYSILHASLRGFGDVLWSYCEDKLTVLKTVVFQASVHVLPMGFSHAMMAAFGCFSVLVCFFISWVIPFGVASLFLKFPNFSFCLYLLVALTCQTVVLYYMHFHKSVTSVFHPSSCGNHLLFTHTHTHTCTCTHSAVHRNRNRVHTHRCTQIFSWVIILQAPVCCRANIFPPSFFFFFIAPPFVF